jgi:superfamily II DNA helicase RecQ
MLLTATCSLQDASSICESLQIPLGNLTIFRNKNFARPEINIEVQQKGQKQKLLLDIINLIEEVVEGKIIIYCATPDSCEGIYDELTKKLKSISIGMYHGNIGGSDKNKLIQEWKEGKYKIMISTNAFGLGINTPDIRTIIHVTFPLNLGKCN